MNERGGVGGETSYQIAMKYLDKKFAFIFGLFWNEANINDEVIKLLKVHNYELKSVTNIRFLFEA